MPKRSPRNFVFHWLDMRRLGEVEPDRAIFPYASGRGDPRADYLTELKLFAKGIFDEDRSVADFLTAKDTYLNERVALLYGITDVKGDQFRRVELKDSTRWGLLGKGAILMAAAYPNRTSPVLRGSFILEYITGAPPARPPLNVPAFPEAEIGTAKARTVRDIMAKHRENPVCFSCHGVMDPLGFALENFDAVGVWRDKDRYAGTLIDSQAELPDGTIGQRSRRAARGARARSRAVRPHVHGAVPDVCARPRGGLPRHAGRAQDRARREARQLQVFLARLGDRDERAVPDAAGAGGRGAARRDGANGFDELVAARGNA